ncbi:SHOCT domain-containing protein [Halomonas sp. M20]|uniref:SHOCT domain-containing protein n=1 Tax=Halomonas sp. M20 TaxID=2763264 RepID=UPI001D09C24C|nr:SHOCT domain-containing protein [Halomonas sp. M20]
MWNSMMTHMDGYGWDHMFFGGIMMVLFWGGIIAFVIWLFRSPERGINSGAGVYKRPSALDLLQERYARGEIDKQEYEERKRDLTH